MTKATALQVEAEMHETADNIDLAERSHQQLGATSASVEGPMPQGSPKQGNSMQEGLDLDAYFGKVIRTVKAGGSFGELALLHQNALRTASVIAGPPQAADLVQSHTQMGVHLIRIGKKDFDLVVGPFFLSLPALSACSMRS